MDKGQHWISKITPMLYSDPDFTSCWRWHNCCELGRSISCLLHTLHNPNIIGNFSVSKRVGPEILAEACVLLHIEKSLKIKPLTSRSHKQLSGKWPEFVESSNIYAGPCCKMCMHLVWFLLLEDVKLPKRIALVFFVAYTYFFHSFYIPAS